MQFDAYAKKLSFTWRPFGNANPLQWVLLRLTRPRLGMGCASSLIAPLAGRRRYSESSLLHKEVP